MKYNILILLQGRGDLLPGYSKEIDFKKLQCTVGILPRKRPDDIAMCCKNVAIYVRNSTVLLGSARTRDYATTRDFCRCIARMSRLCNNSLGGYCEEVDSMMYYCNLLQMHRENIEFEI